MKRYAPIAIALSILACKTEYDHLELTLVNQPPVAVRLAPDVEIPAGIGVLVEARPSSRKGPGYDTETELALRSRDPQVLGVDADTQPLRFLLRAITPGTTCIEVEVDGEVEECIDVEVTAE